MCSSSLKLTAALSGALLVVSSVYGDVFFVSEQENEWKGHGRCVIKRSWSFEFPYQPDRTDRNRHLLYGEKKPFLPACFQHDKGKGSIRLDIWRHMWQLMSRNKLFQPRSLADECWGNNANWMTSSFSQGYLFNFIKSVPSKGVRHFGYGSECF